MDFQNIDQWRDLFQFNPSEFSISELRYYTGKEVRKTCSQLNRRADRRGVRNDLDRLSEVGRLLELHDWLGGE